MLTLHYCHLSLLTDGRSWVLHTPLSRLHLMLSLLSGPVSSPQVQWVHGSQSLPPLPLSSATTDWLWLLCARQCLGQPL